MLVCERLTGGDEQLRLDDIDAGHHLGDRMLHLQTRVDLDKVEITVFVQELEGSRPAVPNLETRVYTALTDLRAQLLGNARRRCLLDHLLVAALHRAVALS